MYSKDESVRALSDKFMINHVYIKDNLDRGPREDYPARG